MLGSAPANSGPANQRDGQMLQPGQVASALEHFPGEPYEQALQMDPDDAITRKNLGDVLLKLGRVDDAIDSYLQVVRLDPYDQEVRDILGCCLYQCGHISAGINQLEMGVRNNPNFANLHNDLGCALLMSQRFPEAIKQFEIALQLDPTNHTIRANISRLKQQEAATPAGR